MLPEIEARFERYVGRFADPQGTLHPMQQLKIEHSWHVRENGRRIASELEWADSKRALAEAACLLHDVGRFPQYRDFGTFQDQKSINHGDKGADVLDRWRRESPSPLRSALARIIPAVRFHNRPALESGLSEEETDLLGLVRDADKLDIFTVVYNGATHPESLYTDLTSWVDVDGPVSPHVLECARKRRPVAYGSLCSLADMVVAQLNWVYDFNFAPSLRILKETDMFTLLRGLIPEENDDVGDVLDQAAEFVECCVSGTAPEPDCSTPASAE